MKINDLDLFFKALDQRIKTPIRVLITGGAAAILFGCARATQDIDFEVQIKINPEKSAKAWTNLQQALDEVARLTGISPQYAEDIARWSPILMPHKKSRLYKKLRLIEVRILDPGIWAIGKLTRYLESDTADLVQVLSNTKTAPLNLARLWGKALGISPVSPVQSEFRRHVDHFVDSYAQTIWGKNILPANFKAAFLQSAQHARNKKQG